MYNSYKTTTQNCVVIQICNLVDHLLTVANIDLFCLFIPDEVINEWIKERAILALMKDHLKSVLLSPHKFQHYVKRDLKKKNASSTNLQKLNNGNEAYVNSKIV